MERDELRFEQDMAYIKAMQEDEKKKVAPKPPEPPEPPEPKLTIQELRAQRIAHFEKT